MSKRGYCGLCGEAMPPGEEMFNYHGYSGNCPKPPLPQEKSEVEKLREENARLKETIQEHELSAETLDINEIGRLREENAQLRKAVEASHEFAVDIKPELAILRKDIEGLMSERDQLREENAHLNSGVASAAGIILTHECTIANLRKENAELYEDAPVVYGTSNDGGFRINCIHEKSEGKKSTHSARIVNIEEIKK